MKLRSEDMYMFYGLLKRMIQENKQSAPSSNSHLIKQLLKHNMVQTEFGEHAVSKAQIYIWFPQFKV
jgi:hypothetical protein